MRNARNRVQIHYPVLALFGVPLGRHHGIMRAASRAKPVAVLAEQRLEDRRHHLQQQLLDEPPRAGPFRSSSTVGIPSVRVPPLGLGISTRLTGLGT